MTVFFSPLVLKEESGITTFWAWAMFSNFLTLYCMRGESWQHQTLPKPPPETITSGFVFVGGCFGNITRLWLSDKGGRIVM